MKTFFSIALLLSTLCSTAQANGVRKAPTEEELHSKIEAALQREDFSGELSFDELGIETERDAAPFCSLILGMIDVLPDFVDCNCGYNWFRATVTFKCSAEVCEGDDISTGGILPDGTCFRPSYTGRFSVLPWVWSLKSDACNPAISFNVTIDGNDFELNLPKTCFGAKHRRGFSKLDQITGCSISIGNDKCECNVCPSQQDITFDCSAVSSLGDFAPYTNVTTCVGLSSFTGSRADENGDISIINPLLLVPGLKIND
jgi:hypothetical protein